MRRPVAPVSKSAPSTHHAGAPVPKSAPSTRHHTGPPVAKSAPSPRHRARASTWLAILAVTSMRRPVDSEAMAQAARDREAEEETAMEEERRAAELMAPVGARGPPCLDTVGRVYPEPTSTTATKTETKKKKQPPSRKIYQAQRSRTRTCSRLRNEASVSSKRVMTRARAARAAWLGSEQRNKDGAQKSHGKHRDVQYAPRLTVRAMFEHGVPGVRGSITCLRCSWYVGHDGRNHPIFSAPTGPPSCPRCNFDLSYVDDGGRCVLGPALTPEASDEEPVTNAPEVVSGRVATESTPPLVDPVFDMDSS